MNAGIGTTNAKLVVVMSRRKYLYALGGLTTHTAHLTGDGETSRVRVIVSQG